MVNNTKGVRLIIWRKNRRAWNIHGKENVLERLHNYINLKNGNGNGFQSWIHLYGYEQTLSSAERKDV